MDELIRDKHSSHELESDLAVVSEASVASDETTEAEAPERPPRAPMQSGVNLSRVGEGLRASSASSPARTPTRRAGRGVYLSECACQQGSGALVYALGELGYDFATQARFDAIGGELDVGKFPRSPRDLLEFLTAEGDANLHFAAAILWTLNHDSTPFYVVRPEGPFAREVYVRLLGFFQEQIDSRSERVSIPGTLDGQVTLLSGQVVPVLIPDLRAMYNWRTADLLERVVGATPEKLAAAKEGSEEKRRGEMKVEGMRGFLERIYFELRNTGQTPQERALNFAATNAFNVERVFESAAQRELQLDEIAVDPSPICRMDSDCWDVRLVFFDPADAITQARRAYRFTVDVSDVVPVLVGPVRSWAVR